MAKAALPPLLKDLNERTVLETIRSGAPISRAEISRRAGISKPTVSLALQALVDAGLVRRVEPAPGRPTYGAVYFDLVPEAGLVLGLDLGARFLRGAICDLRGEIRARQDVEVAGSEADQLVDLIAASARLARGRKRPFGRARGRCRRRGARGHRRGDRRDPPDAFRGSRRAPLRRRSSSDSESVSRSTTTSTSPRSASTGAAPRGASTTSRSSRSAPVSGRGSCCTARSIAGATGPRARSTSSRPEWVPTWIPAHPRCRRSPGNSPKARRRPCPHRSIRLRSSRPRAPTTRSRAPSSPRRPGGSRRHRPDRRGRRPPARGARRRHRHERR